MRKGPERERERDEKKGEQESEGDNVTCVVKLEVVLRRSARGGSAVLSRLQEFYIYIYIIGS